MEEIVNMSSKEIRKKYGNDKAKIKALLDAAPEFEDDPNPDGKLMARGFAIFKEYINRQGRPKVEDPKVSISIRIPLSKATGLRATGPGWQTRVSDFVIKGYDHGEFVPLEKSHK